VTSAVSDFSAISCGLAVLVGAAQVARAPRQRRELLALTAPILGLLLWTSVVPLYARAPFSAWPARTLLAFLCLGPVFWLLVPLAIGDGFSLSRRPRATVTGWVLSQLTAAALAAALMWCFGIDWVTGIGSEPVVIVTGWGGFAAGLTAVACGLALAILAVYARHLFAVMPAVIVGLLGALCSTLWVTTDLLRNGYLAETTLVSAAALAAAAAILWAVGIARQVNFLPPIAPSRRLVYTATMIGLGVTYVLGANSALGWINGLLRQTIPTILPALGFVSAAALVVVGASKRWRHGLWVALGHHLFRSKHDYGDVWTHLTELVSDARTADDLVQRAARFCQEVLCAPSVSLWLANPDGKLHCVATVDQSGRAVVVGSDSSVNTVLAEPVLLPPGTELGPLARLLDAACACPMYAGGQLLGALAIGSPQMQPRPDEEDRRVLRYMAAQVASALAIHRLGEEIADAQALGSFHRMSTFVLHDLKNLVSQQSFVLENAVTFRSDPEFVSDALAAFEDSTNRMRALINKLRPQGQEPPASTECDILEVLQEILAMPQFATTGRFEACLRVPRELRTCPIAADRIAVAQVFRNLLVNAAESLPGREGTIMVSVGKDGGSWRIEVRDNGRGMSQTFLRESLFRPFRTTKEAGLGIGLYQCKATVEAAGGTIAVDSAENIGTAVTITLPECSAARSRAAA